MRHPARLVLLVALLGCGQDRASSVPDEGEALGVGGTAVVGVASSPTTVLPPLAVTALDAEIGAVLYLALNYAEWRDGGLAYPQGHALALARAWRAAGATLTYELDTRRRWSDGAPVRAGDVVFTYELLADPALAAPLSQAAARVDSVVAVDDSTVTFYFDSAYPGMLFDTGVGILPEHVYGGLKPEELRAASAAVGPGEAPVVSGPFRLGEWKPMDRVVLERNPASNTPARLDRVILRIVPDETVRTRELEVGGLDLAEVNSFLVATRLSEAPGVRVERMPQRGYDYIAWNPAAHRALADVAVRRALSLAIDRDPLLEALGMSEYGEKAYGPYGSLFAHLAPVPPDGRYYDPAEAVRLLEAAGWRDEAGEGVRRRDGEPLRLTLAVPAGNVRREMAAEAVQGFLAAVGVRTEIRLQEYTSLFDRVRRRDYEAALLGWQVGLDPDISFFWADPASPINVVGYDSPSTRALIDSALAAHTATAAAPYWRRTAAAVAADYPYAFLWFFDLLVAVGPRLGNVSVDAVGFLRNMHEWGLRQ